METVKSQREAAFWTIAELRNQSRRPGSDEIAVSLDMVDSGSGRLNADSSTYDSEGTVFTANDVLYGKLRPYLQKYWHADRDGVAIGDIYVFAATKLADSRFLFYVVAQPAFSKWGEITSTGVKMPRTNWASLRDYRITLPSLDTQRRIADYLDAETAQIDAMMAKLDEQVELLRERYQQVTRGAVFGDYPLVPIFALGHIHSGESLAASKIKSEGIYPVYGGNGIRGFTDRCNLSNPKVLIGRQGALCGNVHLTDGPVWASEHALVVQENKDVDVRWLAYMLREMNLGSLSTATAQPGISASAVGYQRVPFPPLDEQRRLVAELDEKTARVDTMITKCEELKTLLQERRAALISATATGRRLVPDNFSANHADTDPNGAPNHD